MGAELDKLIKNLNKKYGEGTVNIGTSLVYREKVPFSSPRANYITYGGIPVGMAVEFFGEESGGKTTTALDVVANFQRQAAKEYEDTIESLENEQGELECKDTLTKQDQKRLEEIEAELEKVEKTGIRKVLYVDAENTLDEEWARKIGVDTDKLVLMRPQTETAEQVLQMMLDMLNTGEICLIVLDSLPMLIPQQLYEESMEKKAFGGVAGPMAVFSGRVSAPLSKFKATLIVINQMREDLTNPYNIYKTAGGRALKHLFALRIYFRKGDFLNEDGTIASSKDSKDCAKGNLVCMRIIKTKVCKPDRKEGFYTLMYDDGIDYMTDTVELATKLGVIHQTGSYFSIIDTDTGEILTDPETEKELKFQGKAKLFQYLREDEYTFDMIREGVMSKLSE